MDILQNRNFSKKEVSSKIINCSVIHPHSRHEPSRLPMATTKQIIGIIQAE
jgi:hypothetical protein